ncbi:hypothetical protein TGAMA5MH_06344 [Trichoderma gamsii]|uniref:Uncharacterized protein n=1 Tax=Trichoderma gamsii TaxID=398673 RepID=A0A2K0T8B0_9HYPO|nr:hypothetical protein TGAMA5MH_06344 [Trichoderma gamsii]
MSTIGTRPGVHEPPILIKLLRIKQYLIRNCGVRESNYREHPQYQRGIAAVRAYHKQALNMTREEQREYERLIDNGAWFVSPCAVTRPCNHNLARLSRKQHGASWPKWVMLSALYLPSKLNTVKKHIQPVLGDLTLANYSERYLYYQRNPGLQYTQTIAPIQPTGAQVDQTNAVVEPTGAQVDQAHALTEPTGAQVDQSNAVVEPIGAPVAQPSIFGSAAALAPEDDLYPIVDDEEGQIMITYHEGNHNFGQ